MRWTEGSRETSSAPDDDAMGNRHCDDLKLTSVASFIKSTLGTPDLGYLLLGGLKPHVEGAVNRIIKSPTLRSLLNTGYLCEKPRERQELARYPSRGTCVGELGPVEERTPGDITERLLAMIFMKGSFGQKHPREIGSHRFSEILVGSCMVSRHLVRCQGIFIRPIK